MKARIDSNLHLELELTKEDMTHFLDTARSHLFVNGKVTKMSLNKDGNLLLTVTENGTKEN